MKKSEALKVLAALPKNEEVRIIINTPNVGIDINRSVVMAIDYITHEFSSPCDDNGAQLSCIDLVGKDFDTRPLETWELMVWYFDLTQLKQNYRKLSHFTDFEGFVKFTKKLKSDSNYCDIRVFNFSE
jgi:hypothetical protein